MRYLKIVLLVIVLNVCIHDDALSQNRVVVIPLLGDGSTWRGPWQEDINYSSSDIVEREGSSYIATSNHRSSISNQPPNDSLWDLVAASGESSGGQLTVTAPLSLNQDTNTLVFDATTAPPSNNLQPSTALNYICALVGRFPSRNFGDPTLGQIGLVGFNFAPRGWTFCSGQLLPIASNSALFALYGTFYGGDGRTSFGLPDLRGRTPIGSQGNATGPGLTRRLLGQTYGTEQVEF